MDRTRRIFIGVIVVTAIALAIVLLINAIGNQRRFEFEVIRDIEVTREVEVTRVVTQVIEVTPTPDADSAMDSEVTVQKDDAGDEFSWGRVLRTVFIFFISFNLARLFLPDD